MLLEMLLSNFASCRIIIKNRLIEYPRNIWRIFFPLLWPRPYYDHVFQIKAPLPLPPVMYAHHSVHPQADQIS